MTTTKSYDFLNRLTQISSAPSSASTISYGYAYNSANQRTRVTLADGSYWQYIYDSLGQVVSGHRFFADGTPVAGQQFDYSFDNIGNRTQTLAGGDQTGQNQRSASYTANNLNQYSSRGVPGFVDVMGQAFATNSVTVNGTSAYQKGEYFREQVTAANSTSPVWSSLTVSQSGQNSVSGNLFVAQTPESFGYDLDGNLTSDGRWNYTWDAENRLIKLAAKTSVGPQNSLQFEYDSKSRRIRKQVWSNTTWTGSPTNDLKFLYDGWNLVAEVGTGGSVVQNYAWGLDLSGSLQGAGGVAGLLEISDTANGVYFSAFDGNGNGSALTKAADGTLAARYDYGPFGEFIRTTGLMAKINPFRFSAKYQDDETDLSYYGYRYYNPAIGRWLSRDPSGEGKQQTLYGFLRNSSPAQFDYLGLFTWVAPFTYTLPNPILDPKGDLFGMTAWNYFSPHAKTYQPLNECSCKYKVITPGSAQVVAWWVRGDREAQTHEMTHVNVHYRNAYESFKDEAEYRGQRCMSKSKADCIAQVINTQMRDAYMIQAHATGSDWDCQVYGANYPEACDRAKTWGAAYRAALSALQNALANCDSFD